MSALSIGSGVEEIISHATRRPVVGQIVGTFSHGAYARFDGELMAIGTSKIPAGPLHMIATGGALGCTEGSEVCLTPDVLFAGNSKIDLTEASTWSPQFPSSDSLSAIGERLADVVEFDSMIPSELKVIWTPVVDAVAADNLDAARVLLEGRGSGLTPAGDDVLAGLLLIDACCRREVSDAIRRQEVADAVRSTNLSRAFLKWAARGHSIEPVHRLIEVASTGTVAEVRSAVVAVARIGSSSGVSLICGLALGSWPVVAARR